MPKASGLEAEIKASVRQKVEVSLVPATGGIFTVRCEGEAIFEKKKLKRFPQPGEVVKLLEEKMG